jgi:hypothetical protein
VECDVIASKQKAELTTVNEAIARAETVKSERELHSPTSSDALLAGILELMQLQQLREDLRGLTRTQVAALYSTWGDEQNRMAVRTIEDTWIMKPMIAYKIAATIGGTAAAHVPRTHRSGVEDTTR